MSRLAESLEEAYLTITDYSRENGRLIGQYKKSNYDLDQIRYKKHLGKHFAFKLTRHLLFVLMGKIKWFREFDDYMLQSEINFARFCNSVGIAKIAPMELFVEQIIFEYKRKLNKIYQARYPEYYAIIEGKLEAYQLVHQIFRETKVYKYAHEESLSDLR